MSESQTRRCFLNSSLATSAAFGLPLVLPSRARGANERLNIGVIGVGGRGATDLAAGGGRERCRFVRCGCRQAEQGVAGPFTEIVLLGNLAYRVGKSLEYDLATMKGHEPSRFQLALE